MAISEVVFSKFSARAGLFAGGAHTPPPTPLPPICAPPSSLSGYAPDAHMYVAASKKEAINFKFKCYAPRYCALENNVFHQEAQEVK